MFVRTAAVLIAVILVSWNRAVSMVVRGILRAGWDSAIRWLAIVWLLWLWVNVSNAGLR